MGPRQDESRELEAEVARALSRPSDITLEQIDRLLTDCAAETLRLQARRLQSERHLTEVIEAENGTAAQLRTHSKQLAEHAAQFSALTESLRALRERLTESAAA